MNKERSNLLSADPSFLRGMGRILDVSSSRNVYNESDSPESADYKAIMSDWKVTGRDMSNVFSRVAKNVRNSLC